jgi:hypothetical protein
MSRSLSLLPSRLKNDLPNLNPSRSLSQSQSQSLSQLPSRLKNRCRSLNQSPPQSQSQSLSLKLRWLKKRLCSLLSGWPSLSLRPNQRLSPSLSPFRKPSQSQSQNLYPRQFLKLSPSLS